MSVCLFGLNSKLVAIFKFLAQIKLLSQRACPEGAQNFVLLWNIPSSQFFAELSVHWILLIFGSTFVSNKEIIAL